MRAVGRALELNPNFAIAHAVRSSFMALSNTRAVAEVIEYAQHSVRLSPSDRLVGTCASRAMTIAHFAAGKYADCAAWAHKTIEKDTEGLPGHLFLVAALAAQGDVDAAAAARESVLHLRPEFSISCMT